MFETEITQLYISLTVLVNKTYYWLKYEISSKWHISAHYKCSIIIIISSSMSVNGPCPIPLQESIGSLP